MCQKMPTLGKKKGRATRNAAAVATPRRRLNRYAAAYTANGTNPFSTGPNHNNNVCTSQPVNNCKLAEIVWKP